MNFRLGSCSKQAKFAKTRWNNVCFLGHRLQSPRGGHRRLPTLARHFEEGACQIQCFWRLNLNAKKRSFRKHVAGNFGALGLSWANLGVPKPSKSEAWGLQNRAWSPPRRHFKKISNLKSFRGGVPICQICDFGPTWLQFHVLRTYRRAAGWLWKAESECQQGFFAAITAPCPKKLWKLCKKHVL